MSIAEWPEEWFEFAKKLGAQAHSANDIAIAMSREFDQKFTKNMVVGKMNRHNAPFGKPAKSKPAPMQTSKPMSRTATSFLISTNPKKREPEPVQVLEETLSEYNCTSADRTDDQCSWPIGTLCCGAPVIARRRPYCPYHTNASRR